MHVIQKMIIVHGYSINHLQYAKRLKSDIAVLFHPIEASKEPSQNAKLAGSSYNRDPWARVWHCMLLFIIFGKQKDD